MLETIPTRFLLKMACGLTLAKLVGNLDSRSRDQFAASVSEGLLGQMPDTHIERSIPNGRLFMSTGVSPENELFIQQAVAAGVFSDREHALDEAVGLLKSRQSILAHIDEGTRQLRKAISSNSTKTAYAGSLMRSNREDEGDTKKARNAHDPVSSQPTGGGRSGRNLGLSGDRSRHTGRRVQSVRIAVQPIQPACRIAFPGRAA